MSKYKVSEPSALKFLKENGAVVDENGNVVNEATDYWKKVYDQAEPKVAKYLHADGTIDENPGSGGGGGGSDLEDNHQTTIDVSAYTEPVEITPSEGKDGMKKTTVTLSNIPSGVSATAYAWIRGGLEIEYYPFDVAPNTKTEYETSNVLYVKNRKIQKDEGFSVFDYTRVSDTEFETVLQEGGDIITFTRDSTKDFTLW